VHLDACAERLVPVSLNGFFLSRSPGTAACRRRERHQAQLVDEVVLDQRMDEGGAAGYQDSARRPLLQLADLPGDGAPDQV
jgi:hypothetical protein